ncbi:N-acetylglucosamine-6-phosphate deacetylase [Olsenella sp. YH-ols2217]|uniref:N-acetylglucosamine-6-phosphate deacetylase n=1 Tax=Kribbibacterium absianum TaxID=3044210 RepID=A0ABT6ZNA0_9ACTN|nr:MULTISPECIES: N-acetylglucosamine-6-phosphate deacetylase [unclassified Olsenella]MDJ1122239.1 N-acetylglucosamine-6-phosphate deacetylase [Olsenella sp. YH-ols2216]MDJ1130347.1 N-acetylglucosamine-6-phosphate deacetylase [Olsenella sp. YH-ols2217]
MSKFAIHADGFFLPGGATGPGYLTIEDGVFGRFSAEFPEGVERVDERGGQWVGPGLVDTHIHGYAGHDVMDLSADGLDAMCARLPENGCTSWLPTTLTAPTEQLTMACRVIGNHVNKPKCSRVRGVFLEGPWFSEKYKGAQNPAYMGDPDIDILETWMDAVQGRALKIAIAAERAGAVEFTAKATEMGATVALGHSNATYEEARACVDAGAQVFVHTYNAMSPLHHREPGMVGAALTCDGVYDEVICDGHHVNPVSVDVILRSRGKDETILVTDCLSCGGLPDGDYLIGELPICMVDGVARLREGGNLAGSTVGLKDAVRNVVSWGLATPAEAVRMATQVPAESVGIDDVCGSIRPGRDADLACWDADMNLTATYIGGDVAWEAGN